MKKAVTWTGDQRHARLLGALAIAWLCTAATALPERGSPAEQEACTPDVFSLCSGLIPDEPAILACLQGKMAQLSPACRKVFAPDATDGHRSKRIRRAPS